MTKFEFYKSFIFVFELLVAEGLFFINFKRRSHFSLRLVGSLLLVFGFAFSLPAYLFDSPIYTSLIFILIFVSTVGAAFFVFDTDFKSVLFCCIAGYTTQHLTYEISDVTFSLMGLSDISNLYSSDLLGEFSINLFLVAVYLVVYIVIYTIIFFLFANKIEFNKLNEIEYSFIIALVFVLLVVDVVLNAFFLKEDASRLSNVKYIFYAFNIVCCMISLFLQFEIAYRKQIETSYKFMKQMWDKTKEQYSFSKENIAQINMKCHDLKHQIHKLGANNYINKDTIKELEEKINIYDSFVKTGNDALDVILSEKSLICNKNGIVFTYMIDGTQLSFMDEGDIYSLFGNIIDNAIESSLRLDISKRAINLHVKKIKNIISIRENNFCNGNISFVNGLPKTTKENSSIHGFGTKSIKYIAEKYGGDCTFAVDNDIFEVNIVLFHKSE